MGKPRNGLVNEIALLQRFPQILRHQKLDESGECIFEYPYKHLNDLLKFTQETEYNIIHSPSPCFPKGDRSVVIFGIKSMPEHVDRRDAIRQTWLNRIIWERLRFDVHIVFIIGHPGQVLDNEAALHGDILQLNFTESHYMLPIKDHAYFDYIRYKCPEADFAFKGDDDILLIPENVAYLLETMKGDNIVATGCKKEHDVVMRDPVYKYFMPEEIYNHNEYPPYFSGAAYIMTGELALKGVTDDESIIKLKVIRTQTE